MVPADSRRIPRAPRYSGAGLGRFLISLTGLSPSAATLSCVFCYQSPLRRCRSYNPGRCHRQPRFGLLRVRSPLLAQSFLLSFPLGTKMFQFPRFAPGFARCQDRSWRVSPFGHPRVGGYLPLTAAFRSLSRPSSPPRATGIPRAPLFTFFVSFALDILPP